MKKNVLILFLFFSQVLYADGIKVVTTTTVIYDLVRNIGGDKVEVDYLSRGDQDVHFLEILPSYMMKLRRADLFIKIGFELELWSYQLVDGSRNSDLIIVDLSTAIRPKQVPTAKVDASMGDIHPFGNPHYWLDPDNSKIMAYEIYAALAEQSPEDDEYFKSNLDNYIAALDKKIIEWENKMLKLEQRQVVFFHAAWIYFAERFNVNIAGYVEPKPGIPPTPSHNAALIKLIERKKIKVIVMDVFYSDSAPSQIADITGVEVLKLPTQVFGLEDVTSYIQLIDYIVKQLSIHS
jgi:zinc/manganese transport system substrate-binding protein